MSASNPTPLTKAAILARTNSGLAYYLHHLPNLEVDYVFGLSKATTHPTIPGNESFSIIFRMGEWVFSFSMVNKQIQGNIIDFCRLIKQDDDLSEADVLRIISDELNLDLSGNDDSSASHDKKDQEEVVELTTPDDPVESPSVEQSQPSEDADTCVINTDDPLTESKPITEGASLETIAENSEPSVLPAIIQLKDCSSAEPVLNDTRTVESEANGDVVLACGPVINDDSSEEPTETPVVDSDDDTTEEEDDTKHVAGFVSARELLEMGIVEVPTLVRPFLPATGLVAVVGSSDSGKSTFSRQLAIAVASGASEFLGFDLTASNGRAIYISTEDDIEATAALINKQFGDEQHHKRVLSRLTYLFDTKDIIKRLDAELKNNPADLVICDSYMDLFDRGDANANNQVRRFLDQYVNLAKKHHCLFLFIHHTGKRTDGTDPSKHNVIGSQGFEAKMRAVLELRQDEQSSRILTMVKGNYVSQAMKNRGYVLNFNEETLTFTMTEEHVPYTHSPANKATKLRYTVDWPVVFGNNSEMKLNAIKERLFELYDMPGGTAGAYVYNQLIKSPGKTGYHKLPQPATLIEANKTDDDNHSQESNAALKPKSDV